ncbi:carbohydrate ABC transporter permease [Paenibacillus sp. LHD-117]|uniref:carbohydrate ABC transporter permease n=1 Tax=Paenibacillus sp. LHD-117 TaxID=3071412 RepID=UPI0027E12DA2|nr:carbohydrate ABC transporter permease [Paenibacillus sp. LHD-117]MDQ6422971.1 carbohydrate ABC transporter permease [Paenibacillus sp. LHD-117]
MRTVGSSRIGISLLYVFLALASIVAVFPLLWIILSSFKTPGEMASNPLAFFPETWTFEYYKRVMTNLNFGINIRNSVIVSLLATAITIVISSLAAYGIVRFFPRAGKKMTKLLITTYMFPPILLAVPYSIILIKVGLVNSFTGLVITYLSFSIPYAVWMLIGFFQTVPLEIEEAAKVDGAGKMRVFLQVVLPVVSPGIVATAIYTFINTWNEFLFALLLINTSAKMPISVALYSLTGSEILDWGEMMAASVIVILPSVVFFMIIQKKIAGGLADGSVK